MLRNKGLFSQRVQRVHQNLAKNLLLAVLSFWPRWLGDLNEMVYLELSGLFLGSTVALDCSPQFFAQMMFIDVFL
jgi:hypothetical protein